MVGTVASETEWFGWLLAVRRTERGSRGRRWRDAFHDAGARLFAPLESTFFDPDGTMIASRTPVGRYRFVELADARAAFGERPWFRVDAPCAWVGTVAGFLNWEWWSAPDARVFDLERFLAASRGYVVRLRDDRVFDAIAKNRYRLADAHSKNGFGDGDDLPELGPEYDDYVWATIAQALARIGLVAERITYGTSHNRIRFDDLVVGRGASSRDAWARFDAHRDDPLELWATNRRADELAEIVTD